MFKSKFATSLSTMMAGALGMAATEHKLSVGYGAEASGLTPSLESFVRKHCRQSLVQCRNRPSEKVLQALGIRTSAGTDTAWTFEPSPAQKGHTLIEAAGWDGHSPVLVICPIHPFCWPVKPDLGKFAALKWTGQYRADHYRSLYFHHNSPAAEAKYRHYLHSLAAAINDFSRGRRIFPILVGMERLDRQACEDLQDLLDSPAPVFVSDELDTFDLVSVLRCASWLLSSRFHAILTTMPALVPSAGITMDERIANLMNTRGQPHLVVEADDPELHEKTLGMLQWMKKEADSMKEAMGPVVCKEIQAMGQMGLDFADEVQRVYPEFPRRARPRTWNAHLPELSPALQRLMTRFS